MFCGKCGTENNNGSKFCRACGAPLVSVSNNANPAPKTPVSPAPKAPGSPAPPKVNVSDITKKAKALPKKVIIGACAALVAVIVVIIVVVNNGKTINLNDYLTIEAEGYDGYGTVTATIDWDAIETKYGDKLEFEIPVVEEYSDLFSGIVTPVDLLQTGVSVELEQYDDLSNGDVVAYTWDVDEEEISEYINCKLKFEDSEYTVEGLEEITGFDAFEGVEVSFTGLNGEGYAEITARPESNGLNYHLDTDSELSNDDVITITAEYYAGDAAYYAETYGQLPETMTKEITVSGLGEYAASYDEVSDATKTLLQEDALERITNYINNSYDSESVVTGLTYAGYMFGSVTDTSSITNLRNDIYVIYQGTLSSSNGAFDTTQVFYPVRYTNLTTGETEDAIGDYDDMYGYSRLLLGEDTTSYRTYGYLSGAECYTELMTEYQNQTVYTTVCGDGFEQYAS